MAFVLILGVCLLLGWLSLAVRQSRREIDHYQHFEQVDFPEVDGELPDDPGFPLHQQVTQRHTVKRYLPTRQPAPLYPSKQRSAERVEAVKQRLGDLRTDLVWVIEHPSLFDGNTAESRLFFEKLGTWDDEHRYLSDREAHDLAGSVEDAFTRARRAAERVGLDFYDEPGREEAEVAVKLVTKARSTTGEEARLLMDKVAEILARLLPFDVPEAISAATGSGQAPPQAP